MAMRVATRSLTLDRESFKAVAYEEWTRGKAACEVGCKYVQTGVGSCSGAGLGDVLWAGAHSSERMGLFGTCPQSHPLASALYND